MYAAIDLLRANGVKPRFHGNGFVQLYMDARTRLHIWTPELPPIREHNATIHTHRYDMESAVLLGTLKHTTYNVEPCLGPFEEATCKVVQLTGASDEKGRKHPGEVLCGRYAHDVRHEYWFPRGSRYTFGTGLFHESDNGHAGMTATLFKKVGEDAMQYARILLVGTDEQPTHAFDPKTQPTQKFLWEVIDHVVMSVPLITGKIGLDRQGKVW